jgi:hypothetical protein
MKQKLTIVILCIACLFSTSCMTDPVTGNAVFDKAKAGRIASAIGSNAINDAGKIAIGVLAGMVQQVAAGSTSRAQLQQGAAEYAWKSIGSIDVAGDIQRVLDAAKADPNVAAQAAVTYAAINPQTSVQKDAAVNAIASTISLAAQ